MAERVKDLENIVGKLPKTNHEKMDGVDKIRNIFKSAKIKLKNLSKEQL